MIHHKNPEGRHCVLWKYLVHIVHQNESIPVVMFEAVECGRIYQFLTLLHACFPKISRNNTVVQIQLPGVPTQKRIKNNHSNIRYQKHLVVATMDFN